MLAVAAIGQVCLQHRGGCLLDLQEQRVVRVAAQQQDDERPGPDTADADDLAGPVHDLEALQQVPPATLKSGPVRAALVPDHMISLVGRHAIGGVQVTQGTTIGGWLTIR